MSSSIENLSELVSRRFAEMAAIKRVDDGIRVTTHCMYPSNGFVQVTLRGGTSTVVASDDGGAMGEASAAGIPMRDFSRQLSHRVKDQGLFFRGGAIYTPKMPFEAAPLAITLVANAAQDIALHLFDHMKIKRNRDFKKLLAEFLKGAFDDRVAAATIVGNSNKPHKFENVIFFPNGKRLIIDAASNDSSSVNARVVANLDVSAAANPLIDQRIVYDDEDEWTAADLNLLRVGAITIPFSRSSEVIERLAAHA